MKISVITPSIRPRGLDSVQRCLEKQTFQNFEWLVEIGLPSRGCDLSAAMNRMIKRAKGELLVFYQDYMEIPNDGLQRFWDNYKKLPKYCITSPKGVRNHKTGDVKWDYRTYGEPRTAEPATYEIDWASAPTQAFYDIGGFDETFDQGWSWDSANAGIRLNKAGWIIAIDPLNKAIAEDHDAFIKHPFRGKNENKERFEIAKGMDYKLNYL